MGLFKRFKFGKRTKTRSYSSSEPATPISPMSPISDTVDDVEEDEIDYSPCIQQEKAGVTLQKIERSMIKEKVDDYNRWSTEHKQWVQKYRRLLKAKDSSFQPYTTTLNLFEVTISICDQLVTQFDESSKELEKIHRKIPKQEKYPVKSQFTKADLTLKNVKDELDDLEKEKRHVKRNLKQTQKALGNSQVNTKKYNKLQEQEESLQEDQRELTQQIQRQKENYRHAQKQHRTEIENIYNQSHEKELKRLNSMREPLKDFVVALKMDREKLDKAIENHKPKADLAKWKEKTLFSIIQANSRLI